jgi:hypothetical protein
MKLKLTPAWLSLLLTLTGCTAIYDSCIECETGMRNRVLACKAWAHWSWCYDELEHPLHFSRGFKAGYEDVLNGGAGCQPTLPPRCYWKPCFQTPEGRCKIAAWFDGFSHGAVAAQQDGYGGLGELPISPTARANLMTRYAPVNPACFDGMSHGELPLEGQAAEPSLLEELGGAMEEPAPLGPDFQRAPDAAEEAGIRKYDED